MPEQGFPAYSEKGPQKVKDGDEWDERLFRWREGAMARGAKIGTVHLTHSGARPVRVTAKIDFDDGKKVTYSGPVPGGDAWEGESPLNRVDGDPEFPQTLRVRCWNPKRWG